METKILMLKGEKGDPGGSTWGNIDGTLSDQTDLKTALDAKAATSELGAAAFSNSYNDLDDRPALKTVATTGSYNDLSNKPNLATVALSGAYNDLSEKPTQLSDFAGNLPVSRGGTGSTTASGARENLNVYRPYVLYQGPTSVSTGGSVTLSDSIDNYKKIGIGFSYGLSSERPIKSYGEFIVEAGVANNFVVNSGPYYDPFGNYDSGKEWFSVICIVLNGNTCTIPSFYRLTLDPRGRSITATVPLDVIYGFKY